MKFAKVVFLFATIYTLCLFSCTTIDLYEKSVSIPRHSWKSSFKPSFAFSIKDTSSPYKLFIVLRHNDKYSFNNIYINLHVRRPDTDTVNTAQYDLTLASNEKGWLASGMDDIYEHRISLTTDDQPVYFRKPGNYFFTIEQIMREDPLNNVLDVGLRIEKKQ